MMVRLMALITLVGVSTAAGFHAVAQGPDGKVIVGFSGAGANGRA